MAIDAGAAGRAMRTTGWHEVQVPGSLCAAALIALGGSVTAYAAPVDGQGQPSCVYTLSRPFLVEVSGHEMVSATFSSLPCTDGILPNDLTVCVELQGGGMAPQCVHQGGYNPAQVYFCAVSSRRNV